MNARTKTAAYGLAGLAVAGALVFSGLSFGAFGPSSTGIVSILLTDPPSVPQGVTAVYLTYSGFSLHAEGLGDNAWVRAGGPGTIETLHLVNLSQTISTSNVPALRYNQVSFNVTSALVDFQGKNYSATVNSGKLVVPIVGGLTISPSHPAAAVVDIQVTVLSVGEGSSPQFALAAGARALQVPPSEVNDNTQNVGFKQGLEDRPWFQNFSSGHEEGVTITGAALTNHSLSFTANNQGTNPANIRLVVIIPSRPGTEFDEGLGSVVSSPGFGVAQNGTLVPLHLVSSGEDDSEDSFRGAVVGQGYQLGAGSSFTFEFSGTINSVNGGSGISIGTTYYIVLIGDGIVSVQSVVSS